MDENTQCKMNWPLALVVSAVIHAVGLGLFVMCSDSPGEDGGGAAASTEERPSAPETAESGAESGANTSQPSEPASAPSGAGTQGEATQRTATETPARTPPGASAPRNDTAPAPARAAGSVDTVVYTVQRGDHLTKISKRFKCTITEIAKLNNIKPNSGLRIGQKLKIPAPAE